MSGSFSSFFYQILYNKLWWQTQPIRRLNAGHVHQYGCVPFRARILHIKNLYKKARQTGKFLVQIDTYKILVPVSWLCIISIRVVLSQYLVRLRTDRKDDCNYTITQWNLNVQEIAKMTLIPYFIEMASSIIIFHNNTDHRKHKCNKRFFIQVTLLRFLMFFLIFPHFFSFSKKLCHMQSINMQKSNEKYS